VTTQQTGRAIERWRSALADWAIPQEILDAAPESPWQFSARTFAVRADRALHEPAATPSRRRALEALPEGGSVLDVGSGAGAASLPLLGRTSRLIAVDSGQDMLDELRARVPAGVDLTLLHGSWPDVAAQVEPVDVVVCNHVAYNLPDLDVAVRRMTDKARRRVVLELTKEHPRASQNYLWEIFHHIQRPTRPTSDDAADVVREAGFAPTVEEWTPDDLTLTSDDLGHMVESVRRYLCLGADRDPEIAAALEPRLVRRDGVIGLPPRRVVALWWDTPGTAD
jgi:cyclopropane fatty-acyl-phospholipid synthase-like methyltransferase